MQKRQNALDWFHERYCQNCDRPRTCCTLRPTEELACLLATLIRLLTTE